MPRYIYCQPLNVVVSIDGQDSGPRRLTSHEVLKIHWIPQRSFHIKIHTHIRRIRLLRSGAPTKGVLAEVKMHHLMYEHIRLKVSQTAQFGRDCEPVADDMGAVFGRGTERCCSQCEELLAEKKIPPAEQVQTKCAGFLTILVWIFAKPCPITFESGLIDADKYWWLGDPRVGVWYQSSQSFHGLNVLEDLRHLRNGRIIFEPGLEPMRTLDTLLCGIDS